MDAQPFAACRRPRLRSLIAVLAAVGMLAIAAHSDLLRPVSQTFHPAHTVVSSLGGELAINIDHPHLGNGSSATHHEAFATVVLPNSPSTALAALGLVAASLVVAGSLASLRALTGRGPPRGPATALTGQDLLTRLCSSRR